MKINGLRWGYDGGGFACGPVPGSYVAELEVIDNKGIKHYIISMATSGFEGVAASTESHFDEIIDGDCFFNTEDIEYHSDCESSSREMVESMIEGDYENAYKLARIALYNCDENDSDKEAEAFIQEYLGKEVEELDLPLICFCEDWDEDLDSNDDSDDLFDYKEFEVTCAEMDKNTLYRNRMSAEAEASTPSIYSDMESSDHLQRVIRTMKNACESEEDYSIWKERFIDERFEALKGKRFLSCTYLFAGIGQYETTFPAEQLEGFRCWIRQNGSAFAGTEREASEEEIRNYIALHAAE